MLLRMIDFGKAAARATSSGKLWWFLRNFGAETWWVGLLVSSSVDGQSGDADPPSVAGKCLWPSLCLECACTALMNWNCFALLSALGFCDATTSAIGCEWLEKNYAIMIKVRF